jgi:indolepyruvate ferredoxin oxidoreductase beta subunit
MTDSAWTAVPAQGLVSQGAAVGLSAARPATQAPRSAVRTILIAALGGEGGGVLVDWLVDCALRAGLSVQATSVPGVAQRTGATSYYIEFLLQPVAGAAEPVFALLPVPGCVDVLVSSELLETARLIERGFVSPTRTLLITATHRVATTAEKMQTGDGRFDSAKLLAAAQALALRCVAIDLADITERSRTVISAAMFGALAGSGALPWPRAFCEDAIRAGGVGVAASLAGFGEAFDAVAVEGGSGRRGVGDGADSAAPGGGGFDVGVDVGVSDSAAKPAPTQAEVLSLARARLVDYQDAAYAQRYSDHVDTLLTAATAGAATELAARDDAVTEAARELALWMSYEDIIRVADLKTRRSRLDRVRAEAQAGPHDVVEIHEHLKPGLDEIAAVLPRQLGAWLKPRLKHDTPVGVRGQGLTLATTSVLGFAMLRTLAALRRFRPASLRFAEEQSAIAEWLAALRWALPLNAGWAAALAGLPRLRKGYSDTHARGLRHYDEVMALCVRPLMAAGRAPADTDVEGLRQAIRSRQTVAAATEIAAPGAARPIVWRPRAKKP